MGWKKREKNLIKLMKTVGVLCDIVRTEKKLLKESGYSDEDLAELEDRAGQGF
jgi:hypothetical protein